MSPGEAARSHCDIHVNSQIRESCQMLSTAYRMLAGEKAWVKFPRKGGERWEERPILERLGEYEWMDSTEAKIYWDCYHNHPCNVWVRESLDNYMFLLDLLDALNWQFIRRSNHGNSHGSWFQNHELLSDTRDLNFPRTGVTPFALAMPEVYRQDDPVESYREYYRREKSHLYFQNGGGPMWFGYSKGVMVPEWLHSNITVIGKSLVQENA